MLMCNMAHVRMPDVARLFRTAGGVKGLIQLLRNRTWQIQALQALAITLELGGQIVVNEIADGRGIERIAQGLLKTLNIGHFVSAILACLNAAPSLAPCLRLPGGEFLAAVVSRLTLAASEEANSRRQTARAAQPYVEDLIALLRLLLELFRSSSIEEVDTYDAVFTALGPVLQRLAEVRVYSMIVCINNRMLQRDHDNGNDDNATTTREAMMKAATNETITMSQSGMTAAKTTRGAMMKAATNETITMSQSGMTAAITTRGATTKETIAMPTKTCATKRIAMMTMTNTHATESTTTTTQETPMTTMTTQETPMTTMTTQETLMTTRTRTMTTMPKTRATMATTKTRARTSSQSASLMTRNTADARCRARLLACREPAGHHCIDHSFKTRSD
jgi:hypothetical protein